MIVSAASVARRPFLRLPPVLQGRCRRAGRLGAGCRCARAAIRPQDCRCASFFDEPRSGARLPEIDAYAWADEARLGLLLGASMKRLLLGKGLLARARAALGRG